MTLPNAEKLVETLKNKINEIIDDETVLIGVQRGGELILQKILPGLKNTVATGSIDTSFYRDDFSSRGLKVKNKPSKIDTEINDKHIILIDDVFSTGRTVRAAMNEIFDYGRPAKITFCHKIFQFFSRKSAILVVAFDTKLIFLFFFILIGDFSDSVKFWAKRYFSF